MPGPSGDRTPTGGVPSGRANHYTTVSAERVIGSHQVSRACHQVNYVNFVVLSPDNKTINKVVDNSKGSFECYVT